MRRRKSKSGTAGRGNRGSGSSVLTGFRSNRRLLGLVSLLSLALLVAAALWWGGYFYGPVKFDASYEGGKIQALVLVHRRRAFQIPLEIWGSNRPSTFDWYWLPEVTTYYPNGKVHEHAWCRPFPVKRGNVAADKPPGNFMRSGPVSGWREGGEKEFESLYRNGVKEGRSRTWHPAGQLKEEGDYQGGAKTGPWTAWHDNGRMEWRGEFLGGQPDGQWTTWHPSGLLRAEPKYDQGRQIGEELVYNDKGRLVARKHWVAGVEHGKRELWVYPAGTHVVQQIQNDKLEGPHREFATDGVLLVEGQYANDRMQGRWVSCFPDGKPKWERHYKDDKLNGQERVWRQDGLLESTGSYQAGDRHGHWIEWDPAGNKLAEGDYRLGRRDGPWSLFEAGRLVRQTMYDDGQVIETKLVRPD